MKVCQYCGDEIATPDGVNDCLSCRRAKRGKGYFTKKQADDRRRQRAAIDEAMKSIGLTKVRGALGGTYWE